MNTEIPKFTCLYTKVQLLNLFSKVDGFSIPQKNMKTIINSTEGLTIVKNSDKKSTEGKKLYLVEIF